MTRYSIWLEKQAQEFIRELTDGEITERYIDRNIRAISLDELKMLDKQYISGVHTPVGNK